jgi:hypothetical protein
MSRKQPSHPRDAIEATSRLAAVLETIHAASPEWRLNPAGLADIGRVLETDPAMASLVAAYLNTRSDAASDAAADLTTLKDQIDALISTVRGL